MTAGRGREWTGRGYLQADAADLQAMIIAAHRSGWQVATHAIGDLAIDVVLDAYARALASTRGATRGTASSTSRWSSPARSPGPPGLA